MSTIRFTFRPFPVIALGALVLLAAVTAAVAVTTGAGVPLLESNDEDDRTEPFEGPAAANALLTDASSANETPPEPIEAGYEEPVPERGDPNFEAAASDGSWISYINPRDEYRNPYLGDGSGKICVALVNEDGDPIVGESVPETTVTIPTGESLEWHSGADPMVVDYPLTDHYDRPLDADQFGTNSELPQGDGYMDSHCIEFHGMPEDGEIEYGEVEIDGEHADWIDVVGYIQVENEAWDPDVDPIADAEPYEEAGGWEYHPDGSHGQAVVVLQLDPPEEAYPEVDDDGGADSGSEANDSSGDTEPDDTESSDTEGSNGDGADETSTTDTSDGDDLEGADSSDSPDDGLPGFGVVVSAAALTAAATIAILVSRRRESTN